RILQSCVRNEDLVARYGGEEFVLILPSTDVHGAAVIAERCRAAVESAEWPHRQVTASFGAAMLTVTMETPAQLIVAADSALYDAKHSGRNRVSLAPTVVECELECAA
ncbi:MAG: diguanylate cyclase, partial [Capsulimonas sp.]|nr:diguanylate cyclase [Capsulimonas sp.]